MTEKLAFDITLLKSAPVAADNLSALVQEASKDGPRVTYFSRFAPQLIWDTPADRVSSNATIQVQSLLESHLGQPGVVVSISPPDPNLGWPEARVNLYCTEQPEYYGISLSAKSFNSLNLSPNYSPTFIPVGLQSLPGHINLPDFILQDILSGEAKRRKLEAEEIAIPICIAMLGMAQTSTDPIAVGAWAESQMANAGYEMQAEGSGCGLTNSEIMAARSQSQSGSPNTSEAVCIPIVCPVCNWSPRNKSEESAAICPICTYNPKTRKRSAIPISVFSTPTLTAFPKYEPIGAAYLPQTDFLVSFLFPWLHEDRPTVSLQQPL